MYLPFVDYTLVTNLIRHVLHKYANEDVSLGSWFLGLDVEHIDDRRLCCGTPPGNDILATSFFFFERENGKKFINNNENYSTKITEPAQVAIAYTRTQFSHVA